MQRTMIRLLSTLAPNQMVNLAYRQLTSPQIKKLRPHEITLLDQSEKTILEFKDFQIQTYRWGNGPKTLLLIHGWEGQAGNFADLIEPLITNGFTVYAFDGPSHGYSSKGRTSLFEFIELVGILLEKWAPSHLISHSFGGVATIGSLRFNPAIAIDKYVLLTTPNKFSERINDIAQKVGITEKVKQRLIQRLEQESGYLVKDLNLSDFVSQIQVQQALILHDKNDRVIPISQAQQVAQAWSNCSLEEIKGTGHFRILRTPKVIEKVIGFMNS